jgi:hypothetical protein
MARNAVPVMKASFVVAMVWKKFILSIEATVSSITFPSRSPEWRAIDVVRRSVTLSTTVHTNNPIIEKSYAPTRREGPMLVFR